LLTRAERLIAVSRFEANFFREQLDLPANNFVVIRNGSYLPKVVEPLDTANDQTLIVSVGRLERYKGHHRIIAALPKLLAERPDVRLRIVGSGPYETTLRRIAQELGVADHVQIGAISSSDRQGMASVLSGAKVVVLLSDYESQGMAVMEALALGRPVLVSDTSALQELAQDGLVESTPLDSSPEQVARAVLRLLDQPTASTSVDLPTWEACAADILALYHSSVRRTE
jgi:glycosyltransferase involved in cell wall biosynthesis